MSCHGTKVKRIIDISVSVADCHCCREGPFHWNGKEVCQEISMPQDVFQNHTGKPPKSKRINIPRVLSNAESEIHNFQSHSFRSDMDGDSLIPPLFRWLLIIKGYSCWRMMAVVYARTQTIIVRSHVMYIWWRILSGTNMVWNLLVILSAYDWICNHWQWWFFGWEGFLFFQLIFCLFYLRGKGVLFVFKDACECRTGRGEDPFVAVLKIYSGPHLE
jgi:hypothetical protein